MKLLLVFAFLALVCMARSAPTGQTTPRVLILPDYHDDDEGVHEEVKPADEKIHVDLDDEDNDDDDDDDTTTTTTTRRSSYAFTRNRNLIPTRRSSIQTQRSTTTRTTTASMDDDEQGETGNEYDGDFKYIRDFRKYVQKLLDDIRKLVRNLTGYDFAKTSSQRQQYGEDDE